MKKLLVVIGAIVIVVAAAFAAITVVIPGSHYSKAEGMMVAGDYVNAAVEFKACESYKDASELIDTCGEKLLDGGKYEEAVAVLETHADANSASIAYANAMIAYGAKDYENAIKGFSGVENVRDAKGMLSKATYEYGSALYTSGDYEKAISCLEQSNETDAKNVLAKAHYDYAVKFFEKEDYGNASDHFVAAGDYGDAKTYVANCSYIVGKQLFEANNYTEAMKYFKAAGDYEDAKTYLAKASYDYGMSLYNSGDYSNAEVVLGDCGDYKEAKKYAKNAGYMEQYLTIFNNAEDNYAKGNLNTAQDLYKQLPKDMFVGKVKVSSRLSTLKKYSKFVKMCGDWSRKKGKMKVFQIGNYYKWWYYRNSWANMTIRCIIQSNGKVKIVGDFGIDAFTDYYNGQPSSYHSKYFDKTVSKSFKSLKYGKLKATWTGKTWKISYSSGLPGDGYFRYKTTASATMYRTTKY